MTEFEDALRGMLRERAADVRSLPHDLLVRTDRPSSPPAGPPRPTHRRHRWALAVAAAAAVALLAAALTALLAQPSTPAPRPGTEPILRRSSCLTLLAQNWRTQAARATSPVVGATHVVPAAATADGGLVMLFQRDDNPATALAYHLGYLAADAKAVRDLGKVGGAGDSAAAPSVRVDVDAQLALLTIGSGSRTQLPAEIVAVDLRTARRTVIASSADDPTTRLLGQAFVQDGYAYWMQIGRSPGALQRLYGYDAGSGTRRFIASGAALDLRKSAAGISWHVGAGIVERRRHLPAPVAREVTADTFDSFVSDGASYAWQAVNGTLEWRDATSGRGVAVRLERPSGASLLAVAGPLVYYWATRTGPARVLDVRSGASAPVAARAGMFGVRGHFLGAPVLAADPPLSPAATMRLDVRLLPVLHC